MYSSIPTARPRMEGLSEGGSEVWGWRLRASLLASSWAWYALSWSSAAALRSHLSSSANTTSPRVKSISFIESLGIMLMSSLCLCLLYVLLSSLSVFVSSASFVFGIPIVTVVSIVGVFTFVSYYYFYKVC